MALVLASLLTPAAFLAAVLGIWRIAADLGIAGSFAIDEGLFSHWHTWFGMAAALQVCAHLLNRYGKRPSKMSGDGTPVAPEAGSRG